MAFAMVPPTHASDSMRLTTRFASRTFGGGPGRAASAGTDVIVHASTIVATAFALDMGRGSEQPPCRSSRAGGLKGHDPLSETALADRGHRRPRPPADAVALASPARHEPACG